MSSSSLLGIVKYYVYSILKIRKYYFLYLQLMVNIDVEEFKTLNNKGLTNLELSHHFDIKEHTIRKYRKLLDLESTFKYDCKDWDEYLKHQYGAKLDGELNRPYNLGNLVSRGGYTYNVNLHSLGKIKWTYNSMVYQSKLDYINNIKLKNTPFLAIELFTDKYPKVKILNTENNVVVVSPLNIKINNLESLSTKADRKLCKLKNLFGDKYDYSKTEYISSTEKSIVTCKVHGDFNLNWSNAFTKGTGCPKCANQFKGYGKSNFVNVAKSKEVLGSLYFIKFFNSNELFYKIGITTNSIKQRCLSIPYSKEDLLVVNGKAEDIFEFEKLLHNKYGYYSFIPELEFKGRMECFLFEDVNTVIDFIKSSASRCIRDLQFQ